MSSTACPPSAREHLAASHVYERRRRALTRRSGVSSERRAEPRGRMPPPDSVRSCSRRGSPMYRRHLRQGNPSRCPPSGPVPWTRASIRSVGADAGVRAPKYLDHRPPRNPQSTVCVAITSDVRLELGGPPLPVRPRDRGVHGTPMPEAAVDVHGDQRSGEDEVRPLAAAPASGFASTWYRSPRRQTSRRIASSAAVSRRARRLIRSRTACEDAGGRSSVCRSGGRALLRHEGCMVGNVVHEAVNELQA